MKMKINIFFFLCTTTYIHAISTGANEPIADNMLGLYAKDCALQYCQDRDGLSLWMTLVDTCHKMIDDHDHDHDDIQEHKHAPVARHDTNECSTFLCAGKYQDIFQEYLERGCTDSFDTFIQNTVRHKK